MSCLSVRVADRTFVDAPPTVHVGQPFRVDYTITNHTNQAHVLSAAVAESDTILLAGPRQSLLDAPPHATQRFGFTLLPVVTGQVLARFRLCLFVFSFCGFCLRVAYVSSSVASAKCTDVCA